MEDPILILAAIAAVIISYWLGKFAAIWEIARAVGIDFNETTTVVSDVPEQQPLTIQRDQGCYYAWTDQRFLAQADSFAQLFAEIRQRFPDQRFVVGDYRTGFTEEESRLLVESLQREFGGQR